MKKSKTKNKFKTLESLMFKNKKAIKSKRKKDFFKNKKYSLDSDDIINLNL